MKTIGMVLAGVLAVGCAVLGGLLFQARAELTEIRTAASSDVKTARDQVAELKQAQQVAEAAQVAEAKKAKDLPVTPASAESAAPTGGTAGIMGQGTLARVIDYLKDHPEDERLFAKAARRNVDKTFPFLDTLNLPHEQLLQLKDLLGRRVMDQLDAQVAAATEGLERGTPAWSQAMQSAAADTNAGIRGILGANANGVLAQLQLKVTFQNQVQYNFAPDFTDAGAPISPEQSSALAQTLADANYVGKDMAQRPANYNETDPETGLTPHDLRILEGAGRFLQPAQIDTLKSNLVDVHKVQAIVGRGNSIVPAYLR